MVEKARNMLCYVKYFSVRYKILTEWLSYIGLSLLKNAQNSHMGDKCEVTDKTRGEFNSGREREIPVVTTCEIGPQPLLIFE